MSDLTPIAKWFNKHNLNFKESLDLSVLIDEYNKIQIEKAFRAGWSDWYNNESVEKSLKHFLEKEE